MVEALETIEENNTQKTSISLFQLFVFLYMELKTMDKPSTLEHDGIVSSIENGIINVTIVATSACASCHAKGYCSAFGNADKIIEINSEKYPDITPGDNVRVIIRESMGMIALLLSYIFPVVVLLIVLFATFNLTNHEGLAALASIGAVALYYVVLMLLKNKIKKHFTFELEMR